MHQCMQKLEKKTTTKNKKQKKKKKKKKNNQKTPQKPAEIRTHCVYMGSAVKGSGEDMQ